MAFCCLDIEEVAFHYFLEGFTVCPIEEVSWNLLLFVGLGVNRPHLFLRPYTLVYFYRSLCLNTLVFGLAPAIDDLPVLLYYPFQFLILQPTSLDLLLHPLNLCSQLAHYPLLFQTLLRQSLSFLLRNLQITPQLLYLLLQLLVFQPAGLEGLDELSYFQLFLGAEIDQLDLVLGFLGFEERDGLLLVAVEVLALQDALGADVVVALLVHAGIINRQVNTRRNREKKK